MILILGKGGVGRTTVSRSVAQLLADQGRKTLLCHVLSLEEPKQVLRQINRNLWEISLNSNTCFSEYVGLKLQMKSLTSLFLSNKLTQYLQRAAPGVKEMVLLGKVWFERNNYDRIVVDMPSYGYAIAMLNTPFNFSNLFPGGPVYNDSHEMIETLSNSSQTAFVSVCLPEEMPIQETLDLSSKISTLTPANPPWMIMNRIIHMLPEAKTLYESKWGNLPAKEKAEPMWRALEHLYKKSQKQQSLLKDYKKQIDDSHQGYIELEDEAEMVEPTRPTAIRKQLEEIVRL